MKPHIADAEELPFQVINITPDFCIVEGKVVPFEIYQELAPEKRAYAQTVNARAVKVLTVGSVIRGTIGNTGAGVVSGRSKGVGHCVVREGEPTVKVEGQHVARNGSLCDMNVDV